MALFKKYISEVESSECHHKQKLINTTEEKTNRYSETTIKMPAIIPMIPFVLMLTALPIPLVPKLSGNSMETTALVRDGLPTDPKYGPMYAELSDGIITNRVKVFFKNYTTKYYYRVEDDGILSTTKVCILTALQPLFTVQYAWH